MSEEPKAPFIHFVPQTDAVCPYKSKVIDEIVARIRVKEAIEDMAKRSLQIKKLQVKTSSK